MTFEHYIITRFNLPIFQPKVNGIEYSSCSEEYLQYRFDLFEKYCMPSIINQTCQNFKWLVLFDARTPMLFKKRITIWHERYDRLIPCYLNMEDYQEVPQEYIDLCAEYESQVDDVYGSKRYDLATFEQERPLRLVTPLFIKESIRKCSSSNPDYYITTRIDNDDAFHKDMIATIQSRFREDHRPVVYDFVYTYKFILNERIVYRYPLKNGHFISLVESSKELFKSALYWNHLYAETFAEVKHFFQAPLQIELIHGNNVVNDFTEISCWGLLYSLMHFRPKNFAYNGIRLSFYYYLRVFFSIVKRSLL